MSDSSRLTPLPPLPLNSAWGLVVTHDADAGVFTDKDLRLYLSLRGSTSGDVILDETDATLSDGGLTATFSKADTWTAANLTAGVYEILLYVDGAFDSGWVMTAYTPAGGAKNPSTDTAEA